MQYWKNDFGIDSIIGKIAEISVECQGNYNKENIAFIVPALMVNTV